MSIEFCEDCRLALRQTVADRDGTLASMALCISQHGHEVADMIESYFVTGVPFDQARLRDALDKVLPCAFGLYMLLDTELHPPIHRRAEVQMELELDA